uniref:beta-N-acetylhexosaminidase n=1 Tax=uncultured bacterium contig00001 TaxID=1181493 RepID=A0A806KF51_9BACT|nr:beta-hexosaminidase [uncultured bacterium contig00001]
MDVSDLSGPAAGGIVIFARNLDPDPEAGPPRLFDLIQGVQQVWGTDCPVAVSIDQEGGRVSRLKKWVGETPSLRQIWLGGGQDACKLWGRLWGQGLSLLGISVNFAPASDLFDGREGTGLGDRCASADPEEVILAVGSFLDGLEGEGVRGCLKHFPGLGGTLVDSHHAMPSIDDQSVIEKNATPFIRLANPDGLIMVAHLKTPASDGYPASLHRGHVAENPWGVVGRWIPDDLEMGGCQAPGWGIRVKLALNAGHIALLVCQSIEAVQQAADAIEAIDGPDVALALEAFRSYRKTLAPIPGLFDKAAWDSWVCEVRRQSEKLL